MGFHLSATSVEGKKPEQKPFAFFDDDLGITAAGEVWAINHECSWFRRMNLEPLPVPVSEIAIFDSPMIVTETGDSWRIANVGWQNCGPVPN